MGAGSQRWQGSRWFELLPDAIRILDAAGHKDWTFGGGTALALWLDHRVSYDIDIFTRGSLIHLTSQFCPETKRVLGADGQSQFPGHYLKLELEGGEIDFLTPPPLTRSPTQEMRLEDILAHADVVDAGPAGDRIINVEVPTEILTRKIMFRGQGFKPRDVFDLAASLRWSPDVLVPAVEVFKVQPDALEQLGTRLTMMRPVYEKQAQEVINPRPGYEYLLSVDAIDLSLAGISRIKGMVVEPDPGLEPGPALSP
ncbi:hypothetical protein AA12717_3737 [Gluconacetobacter sacchari DSM 12717]|uniref:Nucleotidyl transferase AbiEii/AbiGii toxin family protein n=2 Tax=Gluconacetobacter sacchari TaxID=92759 RepID=A0A7W4I9X8_9PROT|nr:nucleotidyl transferase AbiEii/AbiGii toxin family protein [Gluconacetobacter sacchari]MBB2158973.1 nucleotidyl transferase AbiEii/AbiGii toxin family protein [Gluconacetobacter sacchari]GBQ31358.1 hypothetical protein AA12717_3737 [Gluconacetobacter sacchari DSM 12717]